jgi:predicted acyl esterase
VETDRSPAICPGTTALAAGTTGDGDRAADAIVIERDAGVITRDGTVLRVNVFRPPGDTPRPVLPSATLFRACEQLRLVVGGRWLAPVNPLTGQFRANYPEAQRIRVTLHWGPHDAHLLVPAIPA